MRFNKKTGKTGVIRRMATFVEYAMLVGLIALAVAVAVAGFSGKLGNWIDDLGDAIGETEVKKPVPPSFP